MKRWYVDLAEATVSLAMNQSRDEWCSICGSYAFVRAPDELGAWVRANQMKEKEKGDETLASGAEARR